MNPYHQAIEQYQAGRFADVEKTCRQILQTDPGHADAWSLLGGAYLNRGLWSQAEDALLRGLQLHPRHADSLNRLGLVRAHQERWTEASQYYLQAVETRPSCAEAWNNLGNAYKKIGELEPAVASYRQALLHRPQYARALSNLAVAWLELGRGDEALACARGAVKIEPQFVEAWNNLGLALVESGANAESQEALQNALRLQPGYADAHYNLGRAYRQNNQIDQAVASYRRAWELQPSHALAKYNLGLCHLLQGNWPAGWPLYEQRWAAQAGLTAPRNSWTGQNLPAGSLLVQSEQGLGDTIQFLRFLPALLERVENILLLCPLALMPLLATFPNPGSIRFIPQGEKLPPFDEQISLLSVPGVLGTTLQNLPCEIPYLSAEPVRIERWQSRLAEHPGMNIGIAWQGNPHYQLDRQRSVPLAQFAPLSRLPGVRLISLQKGPGLDQLAHIDFPVLELGPDLDRDGPFLDSAALLIGLDLFVTSDSALIHLAGALGVPTWLVLPFAPDWRWLLDRQDCPWYPTVRLFRQRSPGDWSVVFAEVSEACAAAC